MTRYAEVIGEPISQSKSPTIHRFWLEKLGIEGDYGATRVSEGEVADYLGDRRANSDWLGCNVTMPLKKAVMVHLDRIDPPADAIGAVNTITRTAGGALVGTNTDAAGFLEPLRQVLQASHLFRMARILGAGGAAQALAHALAAHNFTLVIAARRTEQADALAESLPREAQTHTTSLDYFASPTDFVFDDRIGLLDLVINASPLGMRGKPPLAFDWSHAPPGSIAYDIVTDPVETEFLKAAREAGHETIDGFAMLIGQAAEAFRLFFGHAAPRQFDLELREKLAE
ncbi:shikimate dehydrogenase family protein [Alteriqipengyuania lutimaris]|uniref:Shikimate dehydrogenase (NADP(+)) n=1 Tax=Alteriqipengyuania lutimaris TaxID=1538146 RepID=A0A395LIF5_9SPHN|nr:shikimate dehydrogenase [Alteriqipengyuania lutimaris]MBB3034444.1 shikimate dehydrogenase [Alteriqipengyuania lutimaris]RDS76662.1 shikimate dehydrogenase [Alteriqipengyuania lutimaris]